MLKLEDFKPVELEDKSLFDAHYKQYPPSHSDNMFTTMISWKQYGGYQYTFYKDNLLILSNVRNRIQFRPPSGRLNKDVFSELIKLAINEGSKDPLGVIDIEKKKWLSSIYPKLEYDTDRDYFDYVYKSSDLAELSGSKYSKIRNRLNKFKKNNDYLIEKITDKNFDEIRKFLKRWCLWKDCESDPILENEKQAILFSMDHYFDLKLSGIAIRIKEDIEAIAVFEEINPDTIVIHYEKGSPDYDGIYKAINQETVKMVKNDYNFINRESDMGLPGLRKAKLSYSPHHMVEIYHVSKKNLSTLI